MTPRAARNDFMCGRYNLRSMPADVAALLGVDMPDYRPRYNISPTQLVIAVRQPEKRREAATFRWGMIPPWSKDPKSGPPLINARSETVREKPTFRAAFKKRRCLIPLDGFYEWKRDGKEKQPFNITMRDKKPFALAGLWECWNGDGKSIESCAIVTTTANELMATIHDRMPVIVHPADFDEWLAGDPDEAAALMRPFEAEAMTAYPVSSIVNNARNEVPECVTPLETE